MTCAGCDDCPQNAWHLHVTVQPHWSWSLTDVASALQRDIERQGIRPVVVTNHFHDSPRQSYRELIPTKHMEGTEADASREIFKMGVLLNNSGWHVKRLKIEGDASRVKEGRALYYEAHLKGVMHDRFPISTNSKSERIATIRRSTLSEVRMIAEGYPGTVRIEAAVLDTNPDMDNDWINQ